MAWNNKLLRNAGHDQERHQEPMLETTVMDTDEITLDRKPPPTRYPNIPVNRLQPWRQS